MRCDIVNHDNGCTGHAVRRFQERTSWGDPVTLWACQPCAVWWRQRHPDAVDTAVPYDGETG